MAKLIDLTGQKFDKLTVIGKAPSQKRHTAWYCKCDCGNEVIKTSEFLKKANLERHCGCQLKKNIYKKEQEEKKKYLIGQRFGKLIVKENTGKSGNYGMIWLCQCDCGKVKEFGTGQLTSGHSRSCGCLKLESHLIDITNQKFGKLTALYFIPNQSKWHCKCDCGNECDVDSYSLRTLNTQSCGCINTSIGERNIENILKNNNIVFKKEWTCHELNLKRFDFAIYNKENKIIRLIEFDGEQHFTSKKGLWGKGNIDSLENIQKRDKEKNDYAKEHNIPLVRIPYWERDKITLEMIMGEQYLI